MIALFLAAAVAGQAAEAAETNPAKVAQDAWLACLIVSARELDDGVSDAQTIASAVVPTCATRWDKVRAQMISAQPKSEQSSMFVATEGVDKRMALNVVLKVRRQKAEARPAGQPAAQAPPPE